MTLCCYSKDRFCPFRINISEKFKKIIKNDETLTTNNIEDKIKKITKCKDNGGCNTSNMFELLMKKLSYSYK